MQRFPMENYFDSDMIRNEKVTLLQLFSNKLIFGGRKCLHATS